MMSKESNKQPNHDPGLDLIKRYMLLTLAMGDAIHLERFDDFSSLVKERELTLLELETLTELSHQAIREFNVAVNLDDELQATLKAKQGQTTKELVELYQGRKSEKAYKKSRKKTAEEPPAARAA